MESYELVSDSDAVQRYFSFVDGYSHILDFDEMIVDDPEVLARSAEDNPIAVSIREYKDGRGDIHDIDGQVRLLPQPTRLHPNPQHVIEALIGLGGSGNSKPVPTHGSAGSSSGSLPTILSTKIRSKLNHSQHGDEVIHHVEDGDACLENDLWHPALNSYIHAIEWSLIAYLDVDAGKDIISEEQNTNKNYYFAGRSPDLLSEVQNHNSPLSQKSEAWIKGRNRAERRWIAHHKSGSTLETDVRNVRARLGEILKELFT